MSNPVRTSGISAPSQATEVEPASLLELRVRELLDAVPARTPAPGGGSVAAIAAALAAGLTTMAARFAPEEWPHRGELVERAEELRALIEPLADEDAAAYGAFLHERNDATLDRIVAIPAELVEYAAELSVLAALVAVDGNPSVHGDAAVGADLAAAVARIGARLVAVNARQGDPRVARARALAEEATRAATSAGVAYR